MRKAFEAVCCIALMLLSIVAIALAPFVALVRGRRRFTEQVYDRWVDRHEWPRALKWFGTPDELMPGDTREPSIVRALNYGGYWWATTCWLMRNRLMGLQYAFARPLNDPRCWLWVKETAGLRFAIGWKPHWADYTRAAMVKVPFATVRFASQA